MFYNRRHCELTTICSQLKSNHLPPRVYSNPPAPGGVREVDGFVRGKPAHTIILSLSKLAFTPRMQYFIININLSPKKAFQKG
jgi:hypothetical protein